MDRLMIQLRADPSIASELSGRVCSTDVCADA